MNYRPDRDVEKACRELRTTSPTKIAEWVRKNRTQKTATGKKQQKEISPQAITMWFKRHPKIHDALDKEVATQEIARHAITQDLFVNGTFRKLPSIAKWEGKLIAREAKQTSINSMMACIKMICQGILPQTKADVKAGKPIQTIEGWGLIHPSELTLDKALAYLVALRKVTTHTRRFRISLRNFLKCLGVEDWDDISGKAEASEGKYAHLYVPMDKLEQIWRLIDAESHIAYLASKFSFKTACRLGATLTAHSKMYFKYEGKNFIWVMEKASRGKPKRKIKKFIPQSLMDELPKESTLFNIDAQLLNDILRRAYKQIIPEIEAELKMPFHFWRHMFAQHMLRKTHWNTTLVAKLGGWTTEALERYYGKMGDEVAYADIENIIT